MQCECNMCGQGEEEILYSQDGAVRRLSSLLSLICFGHPPAALGMHRCRCAACNTAQAETTLHPAAATHSTHDAHTPSELGPSTAMAVYWPSISIGLSPEMKAAADSTLWVVDRPSS